MTAVDPAEAALCTRCQTARTTDPDGLCTRCWMVEHGLLTKPWTEKPPR